MYFEMRTYTIRPGYQHEYIKHFENIGMPIICKYAKLIGYWYTDIGELNQVIHIWAYESLDERTAKRAALYADHEWRTAFLPKALPLMNRQETKILLASEFSPIQ